MKVSLILAGLFLSLASCATQESIQVTVRSTDFLTAKKRANAKFDDAIERLAQKNGQEVDVTNRSEKINKKRILLRRPGFGSTLTGFHKTYYYVTIEATVASE